MAYLTDAVARSVNTSVILRARGKECNERRNRKKWAAKPRSTESRDEIRRNGHERAPELARDHTPCARKKERKKGGKREKGWAREREREIGEGRRENETRLLFNRPVKSPNNARPLFIMPSYI